VQKEILLFIEVNLISIKIKIIKAGDESILQLTFSQH